MFSCLGRLRLSQKLIFPDQNTQTYISFFCHSPQLCQILLQYIKFNIKTKYIQYFRLRLCESNFKDPRMNALEDHFKSA